MHLAADAEFLLGNAHAGGAKIPKWIHSIGHISNAGFTAVVITFGVGVFAASQPADKAQGARDHDQGTGLHGRSF